MTKMEGPTSFIKRDASDPIVCGRSGVWGIDPQTGEFRFVAWRCKRSTCRECTAHKARRHAEAILNYPDTRPSRHLLLTLARCPRPLHESVELLFSSFHTLKKRKLWRAGVRGGVRIFGCEFDTSTGIWGPHLHLIVVTSGLEVSEVQAAWHEITGGSWKADLTQELETVDRIRTIRYCAGQIVQSLDHDPVARREYALALRGRRLSQPIGDWYGRLRLSQTGVPTVRSVAESDG